MGCLINLFPKSRGTYSFEELKWKTVVNRGRSSFVSLKPFPISEVRSVRGENSHLHYMSAVMSSFVSRVSF